MKNFVDFEAFHENYGEIAEIEKKIAAAFILEAEKLSPVVAAAVQDKEEDQIRFYAHTLKGASANIFAEDLVSGFKEIEVYQGTDFFEFTRKKMTELEQITKQVVEELQAFLDA